tara:strand:+ start:328 stop:486 length:159 start_codon:yes stop_codon:yes gene_type:complete
MKKTILILTALIFTSCGTATNLTDGVKNKMKNWGKNPCYNEETKVVEVGCKK